jgi:C-terminal processing protease CtpA/Prc
MQQDEKHGPYHVAAGGTVSVARPTPDLQRLTPDAQKAFAYNNAPIPSRIGPSAAAVSPYPAAAKQQNCAFEKIEVLPHNIGYFKLDSFPDPAICGASADGAMTRLNDTSAIVFDLRENRGGDPEMAEQIAAWLFERPAAWYNPRARSAAQSRTHSPVRSSRLGHKPVYILTSSETVDGADQFAYNLKMLKRATVIGERTRGEAHSLMNPYGKRNWEGTGLAPDVEVKASDALQIAEESARARIGKK